MHILSVLAELGRATVAAFDPRAVWGLSIAAAIAVAAAVGVFRRNSILGPARWSGNPPVESFVIALFLGAGTYLFLTPWLIRLAGVQNLESANISISDANKMVGADVAARSLAVAVILASLVYLQQPLRNLGLTPRKFPKGIVLGAFSMLMVLPLLFLISALWERFFLKESKTADLLTLLGNTHEPRFKTMLLISFLAAAPISEEIFFRGIFQTLISAFLARSAKGRLPILTRWLAVLFVSGFFAIVHPRWSWPPIFALAVCLGYVYERTGNLWMCIAIHSMFNGAEIWLFYQQT